MFSISHKTWLSGFHYLCFILEFNVFLLPGEGRGMQASQWECECVCFLCFHQKKERWEGQETSDSKLAFDSIIESSRIYWALTLCMQINRIKIWPTYGLCCSNLQLNEADKLAHGIIIQDRFFSWKRRRGKKEGIKEGKEDRNEERIRAV